MDPNNLSIWKDLIKMYESLPHLWDIENRFFSNEQMQKAGYELLCQICIQINPYAKSYYIRQQMIEMGNKYLLELELYAAAMRSHAPFTSSLWYFDLFHFFGRKYRPDLFPVNDTPSNAQCCPAQPNETPYNFETEDFKEWYQKMFPNLE